MRAFCLRIQKLHAVYNSNCKYVHINEANLFFLCCSRAASWSFPRAITIQLRKVCTKSSDQQLAAAAASSPLQYPAAYKDKKRERRERARDTARYNIHIYICSFGGDRRRETKRGMASDQVNPLVKTEIICLEWWYRGAMEKAMMRHVVLLRHKHTHTLKSRNAKENANGNREKIPLGGARRRPEGHAH